MDGQLNQPRRSTPCAPRDNLAHHPSDNLAHHPSDNLAQHPSTDLSSLKYWFSANPGFAIPEILLPTSQLQFPEQCSE